MRNIIFKKITALAVAVLMLLSNLTICIFANGGEDTEIYDNYDIVKENFEALEVGETNIDNINIAIKTDKNESGTILVTQYGQDKDKVLKYTKVKGGTSIAHYTDLGSDTGIKAGAEFVLEMDIMFESAIPSCNLIEGRKVDSKNSPQFMAFLTSNGTGFTVPGTNEMIQKIELWAWYVVSIVVNDQLREYDIYINGELKAENVAFSVEDAKFSSANKYSCIRALNLTGHSAPITAYVDDISLVYGNEPLYKGETEEPDEDNTEDEAPTDDEEVEEEQEPTLFPAVDKNTSSNKDSNSLIESSSDKIFIAVLGVIGVAAIVFLTVLKKQEEKQQ